MRSSDWSSDVCSSDLASAAGAGSGREPPSPAPPAQRAGWHARFPSAALCTSSLPLQILLQQVLRRNLESTAIQFIRLKLTFLRQRAARYRDRKSTRLNSSH